jgi:autotransporter-associated beta strand protein
LVFGGALNNTYSGDTVISAGSLLLARSANKVSVPGNLVVGPGPAGPTTFARLFQTGGIGGTTVAVNANSLFDLNGYYQALTTLNLRDGGSVHTGVGLLDFPSGGAINVGSLTAFGSHVSAAITGTLGLTPNATLSFNINPFAPFFPFASGPELDLTATIPRPTENLSFAPAGITKNGDGQMRLGGNNTYAGSTFINDGTLTVDGTQPQSPILVNSGTLAGSGTVGHIYMSGGVVAPGDSGPGILTCSNLNAGISASGILRMELNGTTPGSGYDQLNVRGTVNLAGVALQPVLGFTAPTGAQFDLISNDKTDLVVGTFTGLPDGKKLYVGGVIYQINYEFSGRPGNDVALQGLDTPPPPVLLIEKIPPGSVRLIWPTNDPPFSLQSATNLPATNWFAALPLPAVIGTNNVVTNTASDTQRFYRLSNP